MQVLVSILVQRPEEISASHRSFIRTVHNSSPKFCKRVRWLWRRRAYSEKQGTQRLPLHSAFADEDRQRKRQWRFPYKVVLDLLINVNVQCSYCKKCGLLSRVSSERWDILVFLKIQIPNAICKLNVENTWTKKNIKNQPSTLVQEWSAAEGECEYVMFSTP